MDIKTLLEVVYQSFDRTASILVSGSQRNNNTFIENSDIDVIVLDYYSSDVHSFPLVRGRFRIDCTVIPLYDIENVLVNEFEHYKGIILTMLDTGKFISGNYDVVFEIKTIVSNLLKQRSSAFVKSTKSIIDELNKVVKYLDRDLESFERIMLISDMVTLVAQLESLNITNRDFSYTKKYQVLKNSNPSLVNQLKRIVDITYQQDTNMYALAFMKEYLANQKKDFRASKASNNILTIDVDFDIKSPETLSSFIIEKIKNSSFFDNGFQYFYLSQRKYHRIYMYSLTFVFELTDNSMKNRIEHIISFLSTVFENEQVKYNIIESLQEFNLSFGRKCNQLYTLSKSKQDIFFNSIRLSHLIANALSLKFSDVVTLNKFLAQKWILSRDEQYEAKYHIDILNIQNGRFKRHESFYLKNRKDLLQYSVFEKEVSLIDMGEVQKILLSIFDEVKYIHSHNLFPDSYISVPDSIIKQIGLENSPSIQLYLKLTQEAFKILNLYDEEKSKAIYISSLMILD